MGTDIHFYVECRANPFDESHSLWVSCDEWKENKDYGEVCFKVPREKSFYNERNYDLFAILADVRNGSGVAGIDTGDGFKPICAPKGLPNDLSPEVRRHTDNCLEHTPSWLTVSEMLAYDWTQDTIKRGVLTLSEYLRWRPWYNAYKEFPRTWLSYVSGPGIRILTQQEIDLALEGLNLYDISHRKLDDEVSRRLKISIREIKQPNLIYVRAAWKVTYSQCCIRFLSETMPRLWRLGSPENVRCVFYFDS